MLLDQNFIIPLFIFGYFGDDCWSCCLPPRYKKLTRLNYPGALYTTTLWKRLGLWKQAAWLGLEEIFEFQFALGSSLQIQWPLTRSCYYVHRNGSEWEAAVFAGCLGTSTGRSKLLLPLGKYCSLLPYPCQSGKWKWNVTFLRIYLSWTTEQQFFRALL